MKAYALVSTIFLLILSAACSQSAVKETSNSVTEKLDFSAEKIRIEKISYVVPGTWISMTHSADSQINGEYQVDFNGEIKLPYKVVVAAAGKDINTLQNDITKAYSQFFKSNNKVHIEISKREYWIEVRGLVQKPGRQSVRVDSSLEEIVAQAGGFALSGGTDKAAIKPEYIRIVRTNFGNDKKQKSVTYLRLFDYFSQFQDESELLWHGGETLYFQSTIEPSARILSRSHTIQLMGEIKNPGEFDLTGDTELYQYISRAGGPTSTADLTNVEIIKHANSSKTVMDLTSSSKIKDLQPGDIVLVHSTQAKPKGFEKSLPTIMGISTILSTLALIFIAL